jgi:hypothetical protein
VEPCIVVVELIKAQARFVFYRSHLCCVVILY